MKRKVDIEDLANKLNEREEYITNLFCERKYGGLNREANPFESVRYTEREYIEGLKKSIIYHDYQAFCYLLLGQHICIDCSTCPYCRGESLPDENGNTCPFIISNTDVERKFKVAIKTIVRGKYEKKN